MEVSFGLVNKEQKGKILQQAEGEIFEWYLPHHLCEFIQ